MNTPYFIIHEEQLDLNISSFKEAIKKYWPNSIVAYSIKTNSLPWILKHMHKLNILAEAVSDEEYQLAKLCGFEDTQIVFNGPIKSKEQLDVAINKGAIVNIDSEHELEHIKEFDLNKCNLGIRLNIDANIFLSGEVDYKRDGFRFGFSDEEGDVARVIEYLSVNNKNLNFGLHIHCNSITRSLKVYEDISRYAAKIIKKYNLTPSYIDIGGGFFGGIENKPTADQYISVITTELSKAVNIENTKLIIEPGSAFIGSAVDLYTSVLDVKNTKYSRIITTDGSRVHVDPFWKKENYLYSLKSSRIIECKEEQIICGYTCMDHDRIMKLSNVPRLNVGDQIIYHRVGAYTMTFGGPFIRYFPDVYVKSNNKVTPIRTRMSVEKYYEIQN